MLVAQKVPSAIMSSGIPDRSRTMYLLSRSMSFRDAIPRCFLVGCLVADGAACSFTAALVLDTAFMPACEPVAVGTEVVLRAVWRACVVCRSPAAVPAGPGCKLGAAFLTAGIGLAGACCASCRAGLCCLVSVGTALPAGATFLPGRGSRVDCRAGAEVGVPAGPCFEPSE